MTSKKSATKPFRGGIWKGDISKKYLLVLDLRFLSGDVLGFGLDDANGAFTVSGSYQSTAPYSVDVTLSYTASGSTARALSGFRSAEDGGVFGQWRSPPSHDDDEDIAGEGDDSVAAAVALKTATATGAFVLTPVTDTEERIAASAKLKTGECTALARQTLEHWFPHDVCEAVLASGTECLEDAATVAAAQQQIAPSATGTREDQQSSDEQIAAIVELGFTELQARQALLATGSVELACELLLAQGDEIIDQEDGEDMSDEEAQDDDDDDDEGGGEEDEGGGEEDEGRGEEDDDDDDSDEGDDAH